MRVPNLDATRCDGTQDTLVIRIHTDEGIIGLGEVDSIPIVARAVVEAPPSHSIAAGLKHLLIGENPFEVERLWDKMYRGTIYFGRTGPALHAISGVDMALWDIIGQASGRPVCEMLGGVFQREIKAYASALMPETPLEAGRLAEQYAKQGYLAIKFGWGPIGRDPGLDAQLVQAMRAGAGDHVDIMIDAGAAWDLKGALRMAGVYEKYGVYWLEEPLQPDDLNGYRELASRTSICIAGGEQESGRKAFQQLMDEGHLDIIQPDLARCGGLTEGKRIAYMAYDHNKKVVTHAFKTGILIAASAHLTAAIPGGFMIEYTVSESPLARDLVDSCIEFRDGYVHVPTQVPGLGIHLNKQVVQKYRVG